MASCACNLRIQHPTNFKRAGFRDPAQIVLLRGPGADSRRPELGLERLKRFLVIRIGRNDPLGERTEIDRASGYTTQRDQIVLIAAIGAHIPPVERAGCDHIAGSRHDHDHTSSGLGCAYFPCVITAAILARKPELPINRRIEQLLVKNFRRWLALCVERPANG